MKKDLMTIIIQIRYLIKINGRMAKSPGGGQQA